MSMCLRPCNSEESAANFCQKTHWYLVTVQDYVHLMKLCLGSLQQQADLKAETALSELVSEAVRFRGISGRFLPKDTLKNPGDNALRKTLGKEQLEAIVASFPCRLAYARNPMYD